MRISDWSSDVCSSDLYTRVARTPWEIPSQLGRAPRDRGRAAFRRRSMSKDLFGYTIPSLLRGLGVLSAYLQSIQQAVDEDRFMEGKLLKARLAADMLLLRSAERRVGNEWVSRGISRWSPHHYKKNKNH